jgi:hypothetical protein
MGLNVLRKQNVRWSRFSWLKKGPVVDSLNTILNIEVFLENRKFLVQPS